MRSWDSSAENQNRMWSLSSHDRSIIRLGGKSQLLSHDIARSYLAPEEVWPSHLCVADQGSED